MPDISPPALAAGADAASARVLHAPVHWRVVDLLTGDFLGVGRESLLVIYERVESDDRPAAQGPVRAARRWWIGISKVNQVAWYEQVRPRPFLGAPLS